MQKIEEKDPHWGRDTKFFFVLSCLTYRLYLIQNIVEKNPQLIKLELRKIEGKRLIESN